MTRKYRVAVKYKDYNGSAWTDYRKQMFSAKLKKQIEDTFNNNAFKMVPSGQPANSCCKCASGITPILEIEMVAGGWLVSSDWAISVKANLQKDFITSSNNQGLWWNSGSLDEDDVRPVYKGGSGNQLGGVHEFGHAIGLDHPGDEKRPPGGFNFSEYSYQGTDKNGNAVDGNVDLMGEGMGLRPFYFNSWMEYMNKQNKDCQYTIR